MLIDIMHSFDNRLEDKPDECLNCTVFLFTPAGKWRRVGLMCSIIRVWSRMRAEHGREWGPDRHDKFFLGSKGTACVVEASCHNVLAGDAEYIGMEVPLIDIENFYELVSNEILVPGLTGERG